MKKKKKGNLIWRVLRGIIAVYLLLILGNLAVEFYSSLGIAHRIKLSDEWNLMV